MQRLACNQDYQLFRCDAVFPNYGAVIPKENPNVLIVDRTRLLSTVKLVSIFANRETHQVKFAMDGNILKVSAEDTDYSNSGNERLDCEYSGDKMEIGFNSRFLIEMLSSIQSEQVQIAMSLPSKGGILTPVSGLDEGESVLMLVMPLLINK